MSRAPSAPNRPRSLLLLAALAAALFGCATTGLGNVTDDAYRRKPPARSLVIGSLHVDSTTHHFPTGTIVLATIPPSPSGNERLFHHTGWISSRSLFGGLEHPEEPFYLLLDPGTYVITQIHAQRKEYSTVERVRFQTHVQFDVPESSAVYIGAIHVEFDADPRAHRDGFRNRGINWHEVRLSDRFGDAAARFRERYPSITRDVENRTSATCVYTRAARTACRAEEASGVWTAVADRTPGDLRRATAAIVVPRDVSLAAEHGDPVGIRFRLRDALQENGFRVVAGEKAAAQVRFRYFHMPDGAFNAGERLALSAAVVDAATEAVLARCEVHDWANAALEKCVAAIAQQGGGNSQ